MKKTIQLISPHKNQKEILKGVFNVHVKWIVAAISRQFGKTVLGENLACYWGINRKSATIMWVSPTDAQVQKIQKEIIRALDGCGVIKSSKSSSGDAEIQFTSGSQILFRSAHAENNLRGYSVDYLILDEAAFMKRQTVEEILIPMLTVKGKKAIFLSTPKGKNWFWDYYNLGLDKAGWKSYRFTVYDSPLATEEFIETQKSILIDSAFRQEYLAEFVDSASIFDNISEILINTPDSNPDPRESYWIGIDVGLVHDSSVLTLIDSEGNSKWFYRWTGIDTAFLIDRVVEVFSKWNIKKGFIETNGMGAPIYDLLKGKLGGRIVPWTTNNKNKGEIINNLIKSFRLEEITLPNDENLRAELEGFMYKQDELGVVRYSAGDGGHDDIIMSLAIARECWAKYNSVGDFKKHYRLFN